MNIQKFHQEDIIPVMRHIERLCNEYKTNPDIDTGRTHLNYSLTPCSGWEAITTAIAMIKKAKKSSTELIGRAVRKDAVTGVGIILSLPDQYRNIDDGEKMEFFQTAYDILQKWFPLTIWASVHLDEKTPHLHYGFIPMENGRLCAKRILCQRFFKNFHIRMDKAFQRHLSWYEGGIMESSQNQKEWLPLDEYKKRRQLEEEQPSPAPSELP